MKILFIYPEYPETFWSFSHVLRFIRIFRRKALFPPLGILTVSSLLPKKWEKRLIDLNVQNLADRDILWADMIMVSAMDIQGESVHQIIKRVKKLGKPIAVGGPLFSEDTMGEFPEVDHFVFGEGELSLPPFVADIESGTAQKSYMVEGKPDLCSTPLPDWSLINIRNYTGMMIQYSRGCPFDCEFCDITKLYGRVPRTKGADQIVSELNALKEIGWRGRVFFVDDNFIGNRKRVKEALRAIRKWMEENSYPFAFLTEASINLADDDELIELMVGSNFNSVFLGLETPDEKALLECNKVQNTKLDPTQAVKKLQQRGIQVQAGFIVGFDSDDHTIFDRQIEFIQNSGVGVAMVGLLAAIRGTKLHSRLKKEGRLLNAPSGNNTDGELNFVPKMDPKVLTEGYKRIVKTIYSPKEYCQRVRTFVDEYAPRSKSSKIAANELIALIRFVIYLGIFSSSRKYYWGTLFYTLTHRPKAFREVVELLLMGFHCQQIALSIK